MNVRLIDIFLLFLKVGGSIFGGGIVILPLLEAEAVNKRGWLTSEELIEFYAISQVIPGINIPDVSMFIGYKLRGKTGAVVAGVGIIFIPFILIVLLSAFLNIIAQNVIVKGALWGIEVGTIVILISPILKVWRASIVDKTTFFVSLTVFAITAFTKLSPVWIVLVALILGCAKGFLIEKDRGG